MFEPQPRRAESIRLFRSDALEALTHVHPVVVVVVWAPVIAWYTASSWRDRPESMSPGALVFAHALGLLVWTLVEYLLHRFVFHFAPHDPPAWLRRLLFLFHGIHHVQPWDKTRLVMPPAASIPLALGFWAAFQVVFTDALGAPAWCDPVFAGFLAGYLAYDLLHYAVHHLRLPGAALRWLKRHHLQHHHVTPDERFGVSSPLWDLVFRTLPRGEVAPGDSVRTG